MEFSEIVVNKDKKGRNVGKTELKDSNAYLKDCPLNKEQRESLSKYNKEYMTKVSETLVNESLNNFKKDKDLNKIIAKAPFGIDKGGYVAAVVEREKVFKNPKEQGKEIRKSKVEFILHQPSSAITEKRCREYESQLTSVLCK